MRNVLVLLILLCTASAWGQDVIVSTLAGSTYDADGPGMAAQFYNPLAVAVDSSGNIYVADNYNHRIRKITPNGLVSTLAGSTAGYVDGTGTAAKFDMPSGVAVDGRGNVYVADTGNRRIRKITPDGEVSTLAGSTEGYADGIGMAAQFSTPSDVAVDGSGNVYVADQYNHRIRKITPDGAVSTLAGSTFGYADGEGTAAKFLSPQGVAVDGSGNVYVADLNNHRIRKITPEGVVSTVAGSTYGYADGPGTEAYFYHPRDVGVDDSGNIYVADLNNHSIRKITPDGVVTTLAGSTAGYADGPGTEAKFITPSGVAVDGSGNVYVADIGNHRIRKINPGGVVNTLAGSTWGYADGTCIFRNSLTPYSGRY